MGYNKVPHRICDCQNIPGTVCKSLSTIHALTHFTIEYYINVCELCVYNSRCLLCGRPLVNNSHVVHAPPYIIVLLSRSSVAGN